MLVSLKRLDPEYNPTDHKISIRQREIPKLLLDLHDALSKRGYTDSSNGEANAVLDCYYAEEEAFSVFSERARRIRNNDCGENDFKEFETVVSERLPGRSLYPLQLLSANHMAFSQNSCNFSVPGSGKTAIVYGAYAYLNSLSDKNPKHVDSIVVAGPLSSFGPWEDEFESCFLRRPNAIRLDGSLNLVDKKNYLITGKPADITLVSYASLDSLQDYLSNFMREHKSMIVLDEAHKIKNTTGGTWATAAMSLASFASARVILTGTPAPNGYEDLYNLFWFIWPEHNVVRFRVNQLSEMSKDERDGRIPRLLSYIEPYYLRIRKSDLHLPPVNDMSLEYVEFSPLHRKIYDEVERYYLESIISDDFNDDASRKSAFAKIIRLMQASCNPSVLIAASDNPESELQLPNEALEDIRIFSKSEVPAKFELAKDLVISSVSKGEKVLVWTHFVSTLKSLMRYLELCGISSKALYGETPIGDYDECDEVLLQTRESIVREFNDPNSGLMVVVANPAAVAESISLHHSCHTAVYLERGFNAAQYLQSRDRIHRYGLAEGIVTTYYKIAASDTIDEVVDERLALKEARMMRIVESSDIPLFENVRNDVGADDIKALIQDYVRRTNNI